MAMIPTPARNLRLATVAMGGKGGKVDYRRSRGSGRRKGRPEAKKAGMLVKPLLEEFSNIGHGRRQEDILAEVEDTVYRIKKLQGAASESPTVRMTLPPRRDRGKTRWSICHSCNTHVPYMIIYGIWVTMPNLPGTPVVDCCCVGIFCFGARLDLGPLLRRPRHRTPSQPEGGVYNCPSRV